jgi:hypothetical protein
VLVARLMTLTTHEGNPVIAQTQFSQVET